MQPVSTVYIPARVFDVQPDHIHRPVMTELPTGNETILLVDDEDEILEIGRLYLQEFGYAVECTASAKKAIQLYEQAPENTI